MVVVNPKSRVNLSHVIASRERQDYSRNQICMKCGTSNSIRAIRCRRCKSKELRKKAGASRGVK